MSELVLEYNKQEVDRQYPFGVKLVLLYFLNVVDWFCTQILIDTGYFHEVNPFMIWIMDYPDMGFIVKCILPLALVAIVMFFYKLLRIQQNRITNLIIYFAVILYSCVILVHIFNFLLLFFVV